MAPGPRWDVRVTLYVPPFCYIYRERDAVLSGFLKLSSLLAVAAAGGRNGRWRDAAFTDGTLLLLLSRVMSPSTQHEGGVGEHRWSRHNPSPYSKRER